MQAQREEKSFYAAYIWNKGKKWQRNEMNGVFGYKSEL